MASTNPETREILGRSVPIHYGDPAAEYQALRHGAGLVDLSFRARVVATGKDAREFLHRMLTNDVRSLAEGQSRLAGLLSGNGKAVAIMTVLDAGDRFVLDTDPGRGEALAGALTGYVFSDAVSFEDLGPRTARFAVYGPDADSVLARAGVAGILTWRTPWRGVDGLDLVVDLVDAVRVWDALVGAGARPAGLDAAEALRVEAGFPAWGIDVDGTAILSETGLDEAISLDKGCYPGQEVIARIRTYAAVRRRLTGLLLPASSRPPDPGTPVTGPSGADAGRTTSAVLSPALGCPVALAYLRGAFLEPGTRLVVDGREAEVSALPLVPRA